MKARLSVSEYKEDSRPPTIEKESFEKEAVLNVSDSHRPNSTSNLKDSIKVQSQTSVS